MAGGQPLGSPWGGPGDPWGVLPALGFPWVPMGTPGKPWVTHGYPWEASVYPGVPRGTPGKPWGDLGERSVECSRVRTEREGVRA